MKMLVASLSVLIAPLLPLLAWAENSIGLVIAPTQLIFKPGQNVLSLNATNKAQKTVRQRLYLSDEVMGENGGVVPQAEGFPYSVRRMVRFSPAELVLGPGESQVVRVMIRRPADLAAGDYHSHLIFEEFLPDPVSGTTPEDVAKEEGKVGFAISTLLTLGIPVIVQHGEISSSLDLMGLRPWPRKLENGNPAPFEIELARSGNATGVGFLTMQTPDGRDIMVPRRVSVYREADKVTLTIRPTELGQTYQGPAVLRLHEGGNSRTPVRETLNVQIP